jgi:hypothetical protein
VNRRISSLAAASAALTLVFAACGQESPTGSPGAAAPARGADAVPADDALALGKRAVSPFVDYGTPNQTKTTKVAVKVLRVRRGSIADFKHFDLNRRQRKSSPYYIDATFENLGRFALSRSLLRPSVEDGDGREYRPANLIVLGGTFKPCPEYSAAKLRPGASFTGCTAVLLPKTIHLGRVRFQGDVTQDALLWRTRA